MLTSSSGGRGWFSNTVSYDEHSLFLESSGDEAEMKIWGWDDNRRPENGENTLRINGGGADGVFIARQVHISPCLWARLVSHTPTYINSGHFLVESFSHREAESEPYNINRFYVDVTADVHTTCENTQTRSIGYCNRGHVAVSKQSDRRGWEGEANKRSVH